MRAEKLREQAIEAAIKACAACTLLASVALVVALASESSRFFSVAAPASLLADTTWAPRLADPHFGVWPLVWGSLVVAAIAIAVACPLGVLAALYLSEVASPRARRVLKPMVELLAGVPTVVYGFFALAVVSPGLSRVIPGVTGPSALAAGLVIAALILPTIAALGDDALQAVPRGVREAALALGADRVAMLRQVVLPQARHGIGAAIVLAAGRAVGETMIVAIAAGGVARLSFDARGPLQTTTAAMAELGMGASAPSQQAVIFALGAVLFALTLGLNLMSLRLSRRLRSA